MAEPLQPQKVEPEDSAAESVAKSIGCVVILAFLGVLTVVSAVIVL